MAIAIVVAIIATSSISAELSGSRTGVIGRPCSVSIRRPRSSVAHVMSMLSFISRMPVVAAATLHPVRRWTHALCRTIGWNHPAPKADAMTFARDRRAKANEWPGRSTSHGSRTQAMTKLRAMAPLDNDRICEIGVLAHGDELVTRLQAVARSTSRRVLG